jgi:hypothetical protein
MGMFSWVCKGCGQELCEPEIGLVKFNEYNIASGEYDGYGRFGGFETNSMSPAVWHLKCYQEATPEQQEDLTPSDSAPDQGMGSADPRFCSPRDAERVQRGIDIRKRKEEQYDSGKHFPCHNCGENMVTEDELTCGCLPDDADEDAMEYFQEQRDDFVKKLARYRDEDWEEEYLRDEALCSL